MDPRWFGNSCSLHLLFQCPVYHLLLPLTLLLFVFLLFLSAT